jgi:pimeloyl-ACP methyl ester carboxylesterase
MRNNAAIRRLRAIAAPLLILAGASMGMTAAAQQTPVAAPTPAPAPLTAAQNAIIARATALGATGVTGRPGPAGGMILNGALQGHQFAVAIPAQWNHGALLYAHGYSTPGTPVAVATDPVGSGTGTGILRAAYDDGLAAGHSAYAKAGMGVESATQNTLRLRDFLVRLGAQRVYVSGSSMGGNIVLSLLERHPRAFAGGFAMCGVTQGWEPLFAQLFDMRVAYNYLTRDTPYALPGEQDALRNALPTLPPPGDGTDPEAFGWRQIARIATPILALFQAANANPQGPEARIVRQVAAVSGFEAEPASLAFPLVTVTLGADDLRETMGGQLYGNAGKSYRPPEMSAEQLAAFNSGVQRFSADPAAIAYAREWHRPTGRFRVPLITLHNRIDSLVPYAQSEGLGRIVAQARNQRRLVQYSVPGTQAPLPIGGARGYTHCGFTPEQAITGWRALRQWVETGERPAADLIH